MFTADNEVSLRRRLVPYHVCLHWGGKRGAYMVQVLKPWQRWRERRGVGRLVWKRTMTPK